MRYDIELRHPVTGETLQLDEPHHGGYWRWRVCGRMGCGMGINGE